MTCSCERGKRYHDVLSCPYYGRNGITESRPTYDRNIAIILFLYLFSIFFIFIFTIMIFIYYMKR